MFFVLSGFLITGILYDTRESTNFFQRFMRGARCACFLFIFWPSVLSFSPQRCFTRLWAGRPYLFYIYGANIMLGSKNGRSDSLLISSASTSGPYPSKNSFIPSGHW